MRFILALFTLACVLAPLRHAEAHPMDFAALEIVPQEGERLQLRLKLHLLAAQGFIGLSGEPASVDEITTPLFEKIFVPAKIQFGGDECRLRTPTLERLAAEPDFVVMSLLAACSGANREKFSLKLDFPFLKEARPEFQLAVRTQTPDGEVVVVMNRTKPDAYVGSENTFIGFITLGISHIGALPSEWHSDGSGLKIPEGIDHILFVLSLVVACSTFMGIFKNVTGFTLGHSLTLGLSSFGVIHVHSKWVEAFVALSISVMAATTFFKRKREHGWWIALLFGLVHGLAFATVMHELDYKGSQLLAPLVGFNVGVEIGQLIVIAIVVPGLFWLDRRHPRVAGGVRKASALGLVAAGLVWFAQRAVS